MIGYIYKITSPSGRIYIGQTTELETRKDTYSNLRCPTQRLLYNSLKKYGFINHSFEILETINSELYINEILNSLEKYWISFFKSNKNRYINKRGLNLTDGGDGIRGYKHTEKTKKLLSDINIERFKNPDVIEFYRNLNLGRKASDVTKRKMSNSAKGKRKSQESFDKKFITATKNKISKFKELIEKNYSKTDICNDLKIAACTFNKLLKQENLIYDEKSHRSGWKLSKEFCDKVSKFHTGKLVSEATKRKQSTALKGKNAIPIFCLNEDKSVFKAFDSVADALEYMNSPRDSTYHITNAAKNNKKFKGKYWKFNT